MPVSVAVRKRKLVAVGLAILSGIALLCWTIHFGLKHSKPKPSDQLAQEYIAELVHARGMVLVRNPGKSEWREMKTGERLMDGDLIRTDSLGEASVRYKSGTTVTIPETTVFTVRSGANDRIEVSASPGAASIPLLPADNGEPSDRAQTRGSKPSIELQQIIPFGRSLELIGRVEAGSSLLVNNERVEVAGDGTFKHFTRPFPDSVQIARLNLKVTNLAGRTRIWTAIHDFSPHGWEN